MKRLSQHILSLLRLYDNVALPGIGVFSLEYVPASIDRESAIFNPPRYAVSFTEVKGGIVAPSCDAPEMEILSEDNRLLDSYIRKERTSPEEAWRVMSADLSEFRTYLAFGGNPLLKEFDLLNPPYPALHVAPLRAPAAAGEDEEVPAPSPASWRNPDYYYIPVHKKVAKIAACFLLVMAVGLAALIPFGSSGNLPSTASIVPISVAETPSESTPQSVAKPADEPAVHEGDTIPGAASLESTPFVNDEQKPDDRFFAVVAAFQTEREANKYIDSHKGDKSRFTIIKDKKYFLISASSAPEKEDLEANMPLIRSHYPDAWIFALK